ncbi:MAG: hypothetical protein CFH02_00801, partial [Alphaproteobacteria bacterium MarineAlpha3_Bin1]
MKQDEIRSGHDQIDNHGPREVL